MSNPAARLTRRIELAYDQVKSDPESPVSSSDVLALRIAISELIRAHAGQVTEEAECVDLADWRRLFLVTRELGPVVLDAGRYRLFYEWLVVHVAEMASVVGTEFNPEELERRVRHEYQVKIPPLFEEAYSLIGVRKFEHPTSLELLRDPEGDVLV